MFRRLYHGKHKSKQKSVLKDMNNLLSSFQIREDPTSGVAIYRRFKGKH